jgi:pantothenate kinase
MSNSIAALAHDAVSEFRQADRQRYLIGITGQPGAGKSTLLAALVRACSTELGTPRVVGLPMDGFHLTNQQLDGAGLRDRKGAPSTFDAQSFTTALKQLAMPAESVTWPGYSRLLHEPLPGAITVPGTAQLIFIEGNYLLLQCSPWNVIRALLDSVWYVAADLDTGRSLAEAERHVIQSDMANARQIAATESFADRIVKIDQRDPLLKGLVDSATGRQILPDRRIRNSS